MTDTNTATTSPTTTSPTVDLLAPTRPRVEKGKITYAGKDHTPSALALCAASGGSSVKRLDVPPPKAAAPDVDTGIPSFLDAKKNGTADKRGLRDAKGMEITRKTAEEQAAATAAKQQEKTMATKKAKRADGPTVGEVARAAILAGKTNQEALDAVMKAHPKCSSNLSCMSWYRNKLRKDGLLKNEPAKAPKAKAAKAAKAPAKKAAPKKAPPAATKVAASAKKAAVKTARPTAPRKR